MNSTVSDTGMSFNSVGITRKGTAMSNAGGNLFRDKTQSKVTFLATSNLDGSGNKKRMKQKYDEESLIDLCMNLDKRAAHNMVTCIPFAKAIKPAPNPFNQSVQCELALPEQMNYLPDMMTAITS